MCVKVRILYDCANTIIIGLFVAEGFSFRRLYNLDRSGTVSDLPEFFVEGYNLRKPDPGKMSAFS